MRYMKNMNVGIHNSFMPLKSLDKCLECSSEKKQLTAVEVIQQLQIVMLKYYDSNKAPLLPHVII
jgi:hypothetical protein